jgi:membrane fusion protein (multidrug efflux system)
VIEEGDIARFREVQTGLSDTERIEILSGVPEGTRVVTTGALAIRDGERILTADAARARGGAPRGGGAPGAGNGRAQGTGPSSRGSS